MNQAVSNLRSEEISAYISDVFTAIKDTNLLYMVVVSLLVPSSTKKMSGVKLTSWILLA